MPDMSTKEKIAIKRESGAAELDLHIVVSKLCGPDLDADPYSALDAFFAAIPVLLVICTVSSMTIPSIDKP